MRTLLAGSAAYVVAFLFASLAAAPSVDVPVRSLTGTWSGTASDYFENRAAADGMIVTLVVTQTGSAVSGTVTTTGLHPGDNSCSDCHRAKAGTVSGSVSGTSLTLSMDFPGGNGEVTAACTATFSGTSRIGDQAFTLTYAGRDSCEGLFSNGSLPVTRTHQAFTDDALTAGSTAIKAIHIQELRIRVDAVRSAAGLAAYSYADATLTAGTTRFSAQHIIDLRAALAEAYVAAGRTPPVYTDGSLASGAPIKAVHISELRAALTAIE